MREGSQKDCHRSSEFSRTENCILGALARLDDFLVNWLLPGHSGTTPEPTRNTNVDNQGTNEDDSQSDPYPEAGLFRSQTTQKSGPEVGPYMVTGATEEICNGRDIVTEATQQNRNCHDMVTGATEQNGNCHEMTGALEEVTYCPPSSSSGKQMKNRSTSQPQFRSENTPATIEADQILLALQQLANNNNSENFQNNINRNSKLPKSLTTTMPTVDGKSEKFE